MLWSAFWQVTQYQDRVLNGTQHKYRPPSKLLAAVLAGQAQQVGVVGPQAEVVEYQVGPLDRVLEAEVLQLPALTHLEDQQVAT